MLRLICVRVENGISHRQVSLLLDDPLLLAPCELPSDDVGDDAEAEDGDLLLCGFVHTLYLLVFLTTRTAKGRYTSPQKHGRERLTGAGSHG